MSWSRLPLCFELLSPLHIGFLPNRPGTVVAQTRCYVPGKNLWGAVTANVTKEVFPTPNAGNFREVGQSIREQIVFSYFYLSDGKRVFTPDYSENGLQWGELPDRSFRAQFIGSQISTAIAERGGAEDATLHEIEFIRHGIGIFEGRHRQVLLIGYAWINEKAGIAEHAVELRDGSAFLNGADIFQHLVVGGERNYGFGRLCRINMPADCLTILMNLWPDDPNAEIILQEDTCVLSHAPYRNDLMFKGEIEIIAGRGYPRERAGAPYQGAGLEISSAGYFFAPGTHISANEQPMCIDSFGRLVWMKTR